MRLIHPTRKPVTVPNHKELGTGITLKIIKDAGLTIKDYREILKIMSRMYVKRSQIFCSEKGQSGSFVLQ